MASILQLLVDGYGRDHPPASAAALAAALAALATTLTAAATVAAGTALAALAADRAACATLAALTATVAADHNLRLQQRHEPRLVEWWRRPAICLHKDGWPDAVQSYRPLGRCCRDGVLPLRRGER